MSGELLQDHWSSGSIFGQFKTKSAIPCTIAIELNVK